MKHGWVDLRTGSVLRLSSIRREGEQASGEPSRPGGSRAEETRAVLAGGAPWRCCVPAQRKRYMKMMALGWGC